MSVCNQIEIFWTDEHKAGNFLLLPVEMWGQLLPIQKFLSPCSSLCKFCFIYGLLDPITWLKFRQAYLPENLSWEMYQNKSHSTGAYFSEKSTTICRIELTIGHELLGVMRAPEVKHMADMSNWAWGRGRWCLQWLHTLSSILKLHAYLHVPEYSINYDAYCIN